MMNSPGGPHILLDTGGLVITDDGQRVDVIDRGTGTSASLTIVLAATALLLVGFGVVAAVAGVLDPVQGALFVGLGVLGCAVAVGAWWTVRRHRARPLVDFGSVAVLDRKHGLFLVHGVAPLPLDQVRFERHGPAASNSAALVAVTPNGTFVLKRSGPFDGGIGGADRMLSAMVRGAESGGY